MPRNNFHVPRTYLSLLRFAIYSFVSGLIFMVGLEIGKERASNKYPWDESQLRNLSEAVISSQESVSSMEAAVSGKEMLLDMGGILPTPTVIQPGEMGKPFKPTELNDAQKSLVSEGWEWNAYNQYVSDLISVERSLPDIRHPRCKNTTEDFPNLPQTSVIICFHNEAWSILLRSIHSVINRSPRELLKEILLVDDASTREHLKAPLESYVERFKIVKIIRSLDRIGLIKARILGANNAEAEVLTFLDSHIEATPGWLPPLLERIHVNDTIVVCPIIDVINDDTLELEYETGDRDQIVHNKGIFDWTLNFSWQTLSEEERFKINDTSAPFQSPTMAGGLFSISKEYFDRLGQYDPEFDIWGGENLELSFKIWMCGGTLEIVPCSHVGHIFRKRSPYEWREGIDNVLKRNFVRLAKVWLDDYGKYYFTKVGNDLGDYGDISERVALRKQLNCKSFKWYIDNLIPDIFIPDGGFAWGEIRNLGLNGSWCLDSEMDRINNGPLNLYPCHGLGGNQYFSYTANQEIRRDSICMDYDGSILQSYPCHGLRGNQEWQYSLVYQQLSQPIKEKCLTVGENSTLTMEDCDIGEVNQKWDLENYTPHLPTTTEVSEIDNELTS